LARHLKKAKHLELGLKGEDQALDFLIKLGYQIEEINWQQGRAELDIIAKDGLILVFVEVKSRLNSNSPEKAVTYRKQKLIVSAATQYQESINYEGEIRFDVITLVYDDFGEFTLEYFKDAFFPGFDF
jgi:putative endonuclease